MTHQTRAIFKTTADLANWINRNCESCRWRTHPGGFPPTDELCDLPSLLLATHLQDAPFKNHWSVIINGPAANTNPSLFNTPPNRCKSRKDSRGRPKRIMKEK